MSHFTKRFKRNLTLVLSVAMSACCVLGVTAIANAEATQTTEKGIPLNPDANGWDIYAGDASEYSYYTATDGTKTAYAWRHGAQNAKTDASTGFTEFTVAMGGSAINTTALDVTKSIYYDMEFTSASGGWQDFYIVMYDSIDDMFFNADGSLASPGWLSSNGYGNPILKTHDGVGTPTATAGWEGILRSSIDFGDVTGYTLDSAYAATAAKTCPIELNQAFTLRFDISETAGQSVMYYNDTVVGVLGFTQSDFVGGKAYLGILTSGTTTVSLKARVGQVETATFAENAELSDVVYKDESGNEITTITARRGEKSRFKIEGTGEYTATIGGTPIMQGQDGYFEFTMPAGGGEIVIDEPDGYFVTFKANGYSDYVIEVPIDDPVIPDDVKAYLETTYKEDQYTVSWKNGTEAFDLASAIEGNLELTAEFVEGRNYAIGDINGWDTKGGKVATAIAGMQTSEIYGAYHGELESRTDGTSTFTLEGAGYILNTHRIDITRPFTFSYSEKRYFETTETAYVNWSLWESFTMGQVIDANGWQQTSGSVLSVMYMENTDYKIFDDFGVRKGFTVVPGATDYWKEERKVWDVYIGETAEEGYIKLNGTLVGQPTVTQSDFCAGYAYMYMTNFERTVYDQVSLTQSFNATIEADDHASYTIAEQKDDYSTYNFGECYTLNITVDEGYYLESVTVNGEKVKLTDGQMKVYLAWGGAEVKITTTDTLPTYTVTLRVRSQKSTVTVNMGEVFTPEDAVLEGFDFLGWYTDSNFMNEYVPTTLEEDITLFARMVKSVEDDGENGDVSDNTDSGCSSAIGIGSVLGALAIASVIVWKRKEK